MVRIKLESSEQDKIEKALTLIEEKEEHESRRISSAINRLSSRKSGIEVEDSEHFRVEMGGKTVIGYPVASPGKKWAIGEMGTPLKGSVYILGRDPSNMNELVYYKVVGGNIKKRDAGEHPKGDNPVRFEAAIIKSEGHVRIFNLGKDQLRLELELEF